MVKYKIAKGFVLSLLLVAVMMTTAGCLQASPSDTSYWFSKHSSNFVAYDEDSDNINEAGSYWFFTSAKTVDITLKIRINVVNYYSTLYLYKNNVQIQSDGSSGAYNFTYNLSLAKGDSLKLHAFWVNSLMTDDKGFEIQILGIEQDGITYNITEFDTTKSY